MDFETFKRALAAFVDGTVIPGIKNPMSKWLLAGTLAVQMPRVQEMLHAAGLTNPDGTVDCTKVQEFVTAAFKAEPQLFIPQLNVTIEAADGEAFLTQYLAPLMAAA